MYFVTFHHWLGVHFCYLSTGVTVNGKLIGAPAPPGSHKKQRTYFSTITIVVDLPKRAYIEVTPKKVILDGRDRMVLPCHSTVSVDSGVLSVSIVGKSNVTVTVGGNVMFVILLHQYKNPASYQRDHLGFYIGNSKGLSHQCHGLLGRRQWALIIVLTERLVGQIWSIIYFHLTIKTKA